MSACTNCRRSGECQQRRHCHLDAASPGKAAAIGWAIIIVASVIAAALPILQHLKP